MSERCEWHPGESRWAYCDDGRPNEATWCVGSDGFGHVCYECSQHPRFRRMKRTPLPRRRRVAVGRVIPPLNLIGEQTMSDTFTTDNGQRIVWRDKSGTLHACEGSEVHPGVRLLWAYCAAGETSDRPGSLDVPANAAWRQRPEDAIDCPRCLAIVAA